MSIIWSDTMELNLEKLRSRVVNSRVTKLIVLILGRAVRIKEESGSGGEGRERTGNWRRERTKEGIRVDKIITS